MVRPAILCEHEWREPAPDGVEAYIQTAPAELQMLGMLECAVCGLPAINVRANDGREWIGVYGSRFAATTGIHQPQQWIPSAARVLAGAGG